MGRGFKIIGGVLAVLVITFVSVSVYVYSNLDSILKDSVETFGRQYTGVSVSLATLEFSPKNGEGKLSGFIVGNPPGYRTDSAFKMGSIAVSIDISSLNSNTIVIKSINIDSLDVTYEIGEGGSNVEVIGKNVERAAGAGSGGGASESRGGASSSGNDSSKKMIIESLVFSNGRITVSHPLLSGKKIGFSLPTIRLKDIGKDKKVGASPAEVVDIVMDAIENQVMASVGSLAIDNMLTDVTKGAESAIKNMMGGAGDIREVLEISPKARAIP